MDTPHYREAVRRTQTIENGVLSFGGLLLETLPEIPEGVRSLNCEHTGIKSLPALPASLEELFCGSNKLEELPSLRHTNIRILHCGFNYIRELPPLPATLEKLVCYVNNLDTLPNLREQTPNLLHISCSTNGLTKLPELPDSLNDLGCTSNPIESISVLPPNLVFLGAGHTRIKIVPMLPASLQGINLVHCPLNSPFDYWYGEYYWSSDMDAFRNKVNGFWTQKRQLRNIFSERTRRAREALTNLSALRQTLGARQVPNTPANWYYGPQNPFQLPENLVNEIGEDLVGKRGYLSNKTQHFKKSAKIPAVRKASRKSRRHRRN